MKTPNDRSLVTRSIMSNSLSAMWFIIAAMQYQQRGRLSTVMLSAACALIWMGVGNKTQEQRRNGTEE